MTFTIVGLLPLQMPHTKFGKDWPSSYWGDVNGRRTTKTHDKQQWTLTHSNRSLDSLRWPKKNFKSNAKCIINHIKVNKGLIGCNLSIHGVLWDFLGVPWSSLGLKDVPLLSPKQSMTKCFALKILNCGTCTSIPKQILLSLQTKQFLFHVSSNIPYKVTAYSIFLLLSIMTVYITYSCRTVVWLLIATTLTWSLSFDFSINNMRFTRC